jgi:hypothetical protein
VEAEALRHTIRERLGPLYPIEQVDREVEESGVMAYVYLAGGRCLTADLDMGRLAGDLALAKLDAEHAI